jgi:RND family efflux transporter MFP subunit
MRCDVVELRQAGGGTGWSWKLWAFVAVVTIAPVAAGVFYLSRDLPSAEAEPSRGAETADAPARVPVEVVHPEKGKLPRTTHQPGTVQAFEQARLHAEVSGYLKTEAVDIGDHVQKGQVLIEIEVPELVKKRDRAAAGVDQANARVNLAQARVASAEADLKAAQAKVVQANATAKSARAWRTFREKQLKRMQDLFALKSIDERLVDESQDQAEAAAETERSARAAVSTAEAEEEAARAKIKQAEADVASAHADVKVAQAELAEAQVQVDFASIRSPYDGYITQRSLLPGDFVRAGTEGSGGTPLLTVERTDKMRVVVQVPDRDVPYCQPGDPAVVEIDALPGKKFDAKVARIARAEDPQSKLMHVEIDVANPKGEIRQGMYGWVTIVLDTEAEQLSVPSGCLVGKAQKGHGSVYVVRDGRARLVPVLLGMDNGELVAVEKGLTAQDEVILQPPADLRDSTPVTASEAPGGGRPDGQ